MLRIISPCLKCLSRYDTQEFTYWDRVRYLAKSLSFFFRGNWVIFKLSYTGRSFACFLYVGNTDTSCKIAILGRFAIFNRKGILAMRVGDLLRNTSGDDVVDGLTRDSS